MFIYSCRNLIILILLVLCCILNFSFFVLAQETEYFPIDNKGYIQSNDIPETKKGTTLFKKEGSPGAPDWGKLASFQNNARVYVPGRRGKPTRIYREEGYLLQSKGDLDGAMTLYQKAAQIDPSYAVVYNDLGVVYEAKGMLDRAEESYLKAIKIDPKFLSPYSNLAIFYENKRDLDQAKIYWEKRVRLGSGEDAWTQKARKRLEDIRLVLSDRPLEDIREREVASFLKDIENQKQIFGEGNKGRSLRLFEKAKMSFEAGEYAAAIKEALDAQQLDPSNKDIESFIEEAQVKALSK